MRLPGHSYLIYLVILDLKNQINLSESGSAIDCGFTEKDKFHFYQGDTYKPDWCMIRITWRKLTYTLLRRSENSAITIIDVFEERRGHITIRTAALEWKIVSCSVVGILRCWREWWTVYFSAPSSLLYATNDQDVMWVYQEYRREIAQAPSTLPFLGLH